MTAGSGRPAAASSRGRARAWLVLVALLLLLCTATVMIAVSDPSVEAAGTPARAVDAERAAAATPSALNDPVRVARAAGRRSPDDPPGVDPRGEPGGVRVDAASNADPASDPAPPEAEARGTPAGRAGETTTLASTTTTAAGRSARSTMRDDAVCELVVAVTAAETGDPIRRAEVVVVPSDAQELHLRTESDGTARFNVPAGSGYALDVKAPGRVRVRRRGAMQSRGTARVNVGLERGVVIHGFVSDDERRLRGAEVRAVSLDALRKSIPYGPEPPEIEATKTARDGSYVLDCIPRGVACVLVTDAERHATDRTPIEPQPDPDYDVRQDVSLHAGIEVAGVVTGAEAKSVAGATVYAFDADEVDLMLNRKSPLGKPGEALELKLLVTLGDATQQGDTGWLLWFCRTRSRDDGTYRVLLPAHVETAAVIALHADSGRSAPAVLTRPGAKAVDLALRGRMRSEFQVFTAKGQRAEGMTITPHFPWERWSAPPRGKGRYGVADTDDGPILLDVAGPAGAPGTYVGRRAAEDSVRWNVHLRDGVTWRGIVADDRNVVVPGATVVAGVRSAVSGKDGTFEIEGVHPSTDELVVTAPGHLRTTLEVTAESRLRIAAHMRREGTLRLQLVLPRGAPAPNWYRVSTGRDSGDPEENGWEDRLVWNDDLVEIGGWGPRDKECFVFVPGYEAVVHGVTLEPGVVFDLGSEELKPQTVTSVIVVDESGAPVQNARVDAQPMGQEPWVLATPMRGAETDAEGRARIGLPAGLRAVELTASAPGFVSTPHIAVPSVTLSTTIVLGRGREFMGQWISTQGQPARAHLLGFGDVVYADVLVAADGTFRAEVPRLPTSVRIVAGRRGRGETLARADVSPDFAAGALFEIR